MPQETARRNFVLRRVSLPADSLNFETRRDVTNASFMTALMYNECSSLSRNGSAASVTRQPRSSSAVVQLAKCFEVRYLLTLSVAKIIWRRL